MLIWLGIPILWITAIAAAAVDMESIPAYIRANLIHGILYAIAACWVLRGNQRPDAFMVILIVALLCRALALTAEPNLTTDAYRYVWDGRIQWDGWNPYSHIPADPQLAHLRDEAIYPAINQKDRAVTIYPPFAEILFMAANAIADSLRGPKIMMAIMDLAVIAGLYAWLRQNGLPRERLLIYSWHPLPIWEFTSQSHLDVAATAIMMLGLIAIWHRRSLTAGALLALAVMTKYFPLVLLPALWRRWDWRAVAVFTAVCVVLALPYWLAGRPNLLGYLGQHLDNEGYVAGWGYHLVWLLRNHTAFDPPGWLYLALFLPAMTGLAFYALLARGPDDVKPAHLVALAAAYIWITSPHYPWYFGWMIPLLAVYPSVSVTAMTILAVVLYMPRPSGNWAWSIQFAVVYYLPIAVALGGVVVRRRAPALMKNLRP